MKTLFFFFCLFFTFSLQAQSCSNIVGSGGETYDLSGLKSNVDYHMPSGSECYAPQCKNNRLPWDIYLQICGKTNEWGPTCQDSLFCQTWEGDHSASLGSFATVSYGPIPDGTEGVLVQASDGTLVIGTQLKRSVQIALECSSESDVLPQFLGEDETIYLYKFSWKRMEACATGGFGPKPPGPNSGGMSGGTTFLVILCVFVLLYFGCGSLYFAALKGRRGREIIPHLWFWQEFPFYVRDGWHFFISKISGKQDTASYATV